MEEKAQAWSTVLLTVSASALLIAGTVFIARGVTCMRAESTVKCINLMADSNRMLSLAKTYDVKAAASAMVELVKETGKALMT